MIKLLQRPWRLGILFLLCNLFLNVHAQTTITTGLPNAVSSGSGANYFLTFAVINSNSNPITITDIEMYRAATSNGNTYRLFYSSTSLSGSAGFPSSSWTLIDTVILSTVSTTAIHPTFSGLSFSIPGNTTYRFLVQTSGSSLNYGGSSTTPNTFSANGVTIARGNYQINSVNVGYWGNTTNPRFWCGTITFTSGPPCDTTTTPAVSGLTMTSANLSWGSVTGSQGYEYALTTTAAPPTTGTPTNLTTYNAMSLNNGTNYWFHVRNVCTASTSQWKTVAFTTVTCPAIPAANLTVSNISTVSADINWTAVSGSLGYEYALTTSATPPASGTMQTGMSYNAINLSPGTNYYFHLRNKCTAPSNSVWTTKSFSTLACPLAGTPTIGNNVPGSVTFSWPGTSVPGVTNYQWAVTTSSTLPSTWNNTANLTATDNSLVPGTTYYIHVRSNCSGTPSPYTAVQFVNPFPPCFQPSGITISGVNMHGADIAWNQSSTVQQGYQYAVTTSRIPPASGTLTTNTSYTALNLVGGVTYYVHLRTLCGANVNNVVNYSPWTLDSFTTPATCLSSATPSVSNVTSNSADLQWTKYPGIYGYEYVLNTNPTAPSTSFQGAAITFNVLNALNLFSGTNYYFHLRVRCDTVNYSPWTTTPFSTANICGQAPSSLVLTGLTPTAASFSWSPVTGAQQYQYSVTTTNIPDATSNTYTSQNIATANSLSPNTPYYFHVRAYCSPNDLSDWSSTSFSTAAVSVGSVIQEEDYTLVIYPNPVKNILNVEISGKTKGHATVMLYDLSGKVLKNIELEDHKAILEMSDLPAGIYLLKYRDEENVSTLRVSKQ